MKISALDPCPCRSGNAAGECCVVGGVQRTLQALPPARPETDYSHPKCFARRLGNCGHQISGEHYLSNALLSQLETDGGVFTKGSRFAPSGKRLPLSALRANILCRQHNSDLSALDSVAAKLFAECNESVRQLLSDDATQGSVLLLNGYDVERWFLKTLCGSIAAGIMQDVADREVPDELVGALFGSSRLPGNAGLYVTGEFGATWQIKANEVAYAPLFGKSASRTVLDGVSMTLAGLEFTLLTRAFPARATGVISETSIYRPGEVRLVKAGAQRSLFLDWGPSHTTSLTLTVA